VSQANRGKAVEGACELGAREYRRQNRALVFHRETKMRAGKYVAQAGVDFNGPIVGGAIAFDAKETHLERFDLSEDHFPQHQRDELTAAQALGARTGLVLGFLPRYECYWLPWERVQEFLAAPWRASLSIAWCRAFGLLLPIQPCGVAKVRIMWLDGRAHPEAAAYALDVATERAGCAGKQAQMALEQQGDWKPKRRRAEELPPPKTKIEADLRERAGGLDPFHPVALRKFAMRERAKGRKW
jgi:penicillin-binding protein-related factor A (putative recombinase)